MRKLILKDSFFFPSLTSSRKPKLPPATDRDWNFSFVTPVVPGHMTLGKDSISMLEGLQNSCKGHLLNLPGSGLRVIEDEGYFGGRKKLEEEPSVRGSALA